MVALHGSFANLHSMCEQAAESGGACRMSTTETTRALETMIKTVLRLREQREVLFGILNDCRIYLQVQDYLADGADEVGKKLAQRIDEALGEVERVQ
jgi:hypothetical protein